MKKAILKKCTCKEPETWQGDGTLCFCCLGAVRSKKKKLKPILEKERQTFYRLWHSYHAKHKIPYSHEEKERMFNSVVEIFREG